jgi:sugar O-acyltransferase (sialic acid O-acetyltransferase NeuD family)
VYGARGFGVQVLEHVQSVSAHAAETGLGLAVGFIDDDPALWNTSVHGMPVLGGLDLLLGLSVPFQVVFGLASPTSKRTIYVSVRKQGYGTFPSVVSPLASLSSTAQVGEGCVLLSWTGVAIGVRLGLCCYVDALCTIGHNTRIGDFSSIMASVNVSGECLIGSECWLGVNATILQGVSIGQGSTVGASALVFRDVAPGTTVAGNPARVVPK